jgi:hypothetical protein
VQRSPLSRFNMAPLTTDTSAEAHLRQPWKTWYQPAQVPESDLNFVWPITLAAFASGNGAKCVKRNISLERGDKKEDKKEDNAAAK